MPYDQREAVLSSIRYVDLILPEHHRDQKITDVQEHHIDIFVMWDDREGKFDFLQEYCEVVYLPRTPLVSSTKIKAKIGDKGNVEYQEIWDNG